MSQVHLHEIESSKLHAYQKRQQRDELDAREAAQAHVHRMELNAAHAQHEVIRKQAEAVLQAYVKKEEEERRKREEEEEKQRRIEEEMRRKEEDEARKKAEQERRAREEQEYRERQERAREAAERRAKEEATAAEKKRNEEEATQQRQREDQARLDQEAALKRKEEAAAVAKAAEASQLATTNASRSRPQGSATNVEKLHNDYLALHKKLKSFRSDFWASTRTDPALKPHVGDMRRAMRTSVGQLTDDRAANRTAVSTSISCMRMVHRLTNRIARQSQDHLDASPQRTSIWPSTSQRLSASTSQSWRQQSNQGPLAGCLPPLDLQQGCHRLVRE